MKYLFIDIRKSDEVYSKRFYKVSKKYEVYNIPMNMIRFNINTIIKHTKWVDKIYIVCNSAKRSQVIKDKYFSDVENILVSKNLQMNNLNIGENEVILSGEKINIQIIGNDSFNLYNIMRITQIILGTLILLLGGFTLYELIYNKNNKKPSKIPLIILLFFGINSLINGLTSTCTISNLFIDYLN